MPAVTTDKSSLSYNDNQFEFNVLPAVTIMQKSPSASESEESIGFGAYISQHDTDNEARDSIASITIKCPSNTTVGDTFGEEMNKPSYRNSRVSLKTAALTTGALGGIGMKHRSIVDIYKESKQASATNLTQGQPKNSVSARPSQTGVRISLTGVARPSQAGLQCGFSNLSYFGQKFTFLVKRTWKKGRF